jgi:hypothetical protein
MCNVQYAISNTDAGQSTRCSFPIDNDYIVVVIVIVTAAVDLLSMQ